MPAAPYLIAVGGWIKVYGSAAAFAARRLPCREGVGKEGRVTFNLLPTNGSTKQEAGVLGGHVDLSLIHI